MITFKEASEELEKARLIIYRIRAKSKGASWLCCACKSIEALIQGLQRSIDHVKAMTK